MDGIKKINNMKIPRCHRAPCTVPPQPANDVRTVPFPVYLQVLLNACVRGCLVPGVSGSASHSGGVPVCARECGSWLRSFGYYVHVG